MNVTVKEVKFDKGVEMRAFPSSFEPHEIDDVIITFKTSNDKVEMDGELTVEREEFEKNVSNLEQMIKGYILE